MDVNAAAVAMTRTSIVDPVAITADFKRSLEGSFPGIEKLSEIR